MALSHSYSTEKPWSFFVPAHFCRFYAADVRPAHQSEEILTTLFFDWFSIFIDSSLPYLWQTALSSCDLQKLQSVFPPSNQTVWIMQLKNSPTIQKDQRGQSSHPVLPSSYFFITFHWSLSHLICCVWASVIFFFLSVCGNSGVCIPKADETVQKFFT